MSDRRRVASSINLTTLVRSVLADAGVRRHPARPAELAQLSAPAYESILACDFLTIDTVWLRHFRAGFLSIGSRRIEAPACTATRHGPGYASAQL
jgi:hypothetical protein